MIVLPFVTGSFFGVEVPFLAGGGKEASFLPTAVIFLVFSVPMLLWVHERPALKPPGASFRQAYREVWEGVSATKKYPGVLRFLIADYFFEDAAMTVVLNIGIYCSLVLGFEEEAITTFLIVSTISAVVGSFAVGKVAEIWRLKPLLTLIVAGFAASLLVFVFTRSTTVVWILGSVVGVCLGGLWTTTRPYLGELVPKGELGRFFGLFSLSGRAAAVVGPLLWTTTVYFFRPERTFGRAAVEWLDLDAGQGASLPYKMGLLSLFVMMIIGLIIFAGVPGPVRRAHADQ
jgi:UMF1 family MFS transporter